MNATTLKLTLFDPVFMSLLLLKKTLCSFASLERKKTNELFFKTGKGQYGSGDRFIGVSSPDCHMVALQFQNLPFEEIKKLLQSKIHEERVVALLILVRTFEKGNEREKERVYTFYLKYFQYVNNWDLVDASAYKIVGTYLVTHPQKSSVLGRYAQSKNLWQRRLSMVATLAFIRCNEFVWTMKNAETLLSDTYDLTHKAVGWMLREVWKRDHTLVEDFLNKFYEKIPRTTLRYAIERMDEPKRVQFLHRKTIRL